MTDSPLPATPVRAPFSAADLVALLVCTAAWGTTWYAITLQFGVVEPTVSVVYRFAIAAAALMGWAWASGIPLALSARQHRAAFAVGLATFAVQYPLVYAAETTVASAVVAVLFAALAFVNLIVFRVLFGERPTPLAWAAAAMGIGGVLVLSWSEVVDARMDGAALTGLTLTLAAVLVCSLGNAAAREVERAGASIVASTGWAMAYGTLILAAYAGLTGAPWTFDARPTYVLSLLYLAIIGSVLAFLLYFGLARRHGFATASYISALTPPVAMVVSAVFENKTWSLMALLGVAVIVAGQWLLTRLPRA
ncbi:MAG: EamA family transporter [Hyphomonadaceae bacterium]|nr:EamA family transporter [Hyphomonadaceae bacterium]